MAVVGAGVVGCAVARSLARRGQRVLVLEKEPEVARHQSGRNSGVVHAGFTYKPQSLKARFSVPGAAQLKAYCAERGVPCREVGKLVVARSEAERAELQRLLVQGAANGVPGLRLLGPEELREVEPESSGIAALHSPRTGIVDGTAYVRALAADAQEAGASFRFGEPLRSAERREGAWQLRAERGEHVADRVVTCSGLQSDRVVRAFGLRWPHRVVPFRGEYYRLRRPELVRGLLYPVADPRFPFVGIHFTKRTDGSVLVGPSAVLALGREAYRSKLQAQPRDVAAMAGFGGFWRMLARRDVRAQARRELAHLMPRRYFRSAQALLPALRPDDLVPSHSGIRAQVVSPQGELLDDLLLAEQEGAVHVMNAVSPGLTCSLPLAEHVAERVLA
ncbi:MAG: L-2-hydroxyglutarate oxidase [Halobacteriales archaeon]|nr:L-2-hydroxyglutarate oxidase [Halobacteriales archaeon]